MRVAVNLLPWRVWKLRRQRRCWMQIALTLLLLLLAVSGRVATGIRMQLADLVSQHAALTQQIKSLDALLVQQKAALQQLEQLRSLCLRRQRITKQLQAWHQFWLRLPDLLPESLWLTQLEKRDALLVLEGRAHSVQAVRDFRMRLAGLSLFTQVRQGELHHEPEGNYRFVLRARLREVQ